MDNIFLNNFIDSLIWVVIRGTSQKIALTGIRTPDLETWNCLDWDSNPRPGNVELPWLGLEPQTWKHGVALTGIRTPDVENVEFEVEVELAQPIASHSVPMGVH